MDCDTLDDAGAPWKTMTGSLHPGLTIFTTAQALSMAFETDGSVTDDGFELEVSAITKEEAASIAGEQGEEDFTVLWMEGFLRHNHWTQIWLKNQMRIK